MSIEWVMMLPLKVFTTLKGNFSQTIKDSYSMADNNFTTLESSDTNAVFPLVYFSSLPTSERGMDLQGSTINAGLFAFQIDVTDNQSQSRARKVMTECMRIMKEMGFEVISMPNFTSTTDTHRMSARFRRIIGGNDII